MSHFTMKPEEILFLTPLTRAAQHGSVHRSLKYGEIFTSSPSDKNTPGPAKHTHDNCHKARQPRAQAPSLAFHTMEIYVATLSISPSTK